MINISEKLIIQIELEAEKAYPNECCGIIVGAIKNNKKYAVQILASINDSAKSERYHRFVITPETMLKAEQLARLIHLDIIGFYHSHPDCPAVPSEYDTTHALPVYSYIIVLVVNGKVLEFTSWELDKAADYKEFQNEAVNTSRGEK